MTSDDAATGRLITPLLAARRSPTRFDQTRPMGAAEVESLLDAARWAPSAGNSQPWAFIVGRRGEPEYARLLAHLVGASRNWAPTAALLVANLSHRFVQDTDWDYSEFALYDLGQAVAHMTVQAQFLGLSVRQFRAFDRAGIATEFGVPPHWEVTTMSAIGYAASDPSTPPPTATPTPNPSGRARRPLSDLRWPEADTDSR